MPRRKEPSSLCDITLSCLKEELLHVFEVTEINLKCYEINNNITSATKYIASVCDSLPSSLCVSLFEDMSEEFSKWEYNLSSYPSFDKSVLETIKRLVGPHFRSLEITPKYTRQLLDVLLNNLPYFGRLTKLQIKCSLHYDDETLIITGLKSLCNLKELYFSNNCTNDIILTVGEYCKALEKIVVKHCNCVTDYGVKFLVNCKQLRIVFLYKTSVSIAGFSTLLLGLPLLERLGFCNNIDVLHNVTTCDKVHSSFKITEFLETHITPSEMQLIVLNCPYIRKMTVYPPSAKGLSLIHNLKYLKELLLYELMFYKHVRETLTHIGHQLTVLILLDVQPLNNDVLAHTGQCCPNLNKLVISRNKSEGVADSINLPFQKDVCFSKLEYFQFEGVTESFDIKFVLSISYNIKEISLFTYPSISKSYIDSILEKNPLKYLECLTIYSADLGMDTVQTLLSHCDNITRLSFLKYWSFIKHEELRILKENLKETNASLEIDVDTLPSELKYAQGELGLWFE